MSEERFKFQLDPEQIDQNLRDLGEQVRRMATGHRYSKVRISWKGKAVMPDIPLGLFIAGEVASFWFAGPLRVLLVNLGVGAIVEVEIVNEADEEVQDGKQHFMDGDVDLAEASYRSALKKKPGDPSALHALAVLLRVTGRVAEARERLDEALESADEDHPERERMQALRDKLG